MSMFPNLDRDEVLAATEAHWDLAGVIPVPLGDWLTCPVCGDDTPQLRFCRFHGRDGDEPTVPFRCDMSFKCTACAAVWVHGVALSDEAWDRRPSEHGDRPIHWRIAERLLGQ